MSLEKQVSGQSNTEIEFDPKLPVKEGRHYFSYNEKATITIDDVAKCRDPARKVNNKRKKDFSEAKLKLKKQSFSFKVFVGKSKC